MYIVVTVLLYPLPFNLIVYFFSFKKYFYKTF